MCLFKNTLKNTHTHTHTLLEIFVKRWNALLQMGCLNIADLKGFEVIVMLCLSGLAKKLGLSKQKKTKCDLRFERFYKV